MRAFGLSLALVAALATTTWGAYGDQWILGIRHFDNQGSFTTYAGTGYNGPTSSGNASFAGNSYGRGGADGVARVYWELSGNSIKNGAVVPNTPVPTTTELYSIEFFGGPIIGSSTHQPIESQFKGSGGETWPIEPLIPWNGAFGTNHQYISSFAVNDNNWHAINVDSHGPANTAQNAGVGPYMWLTRNSWLYAKWDFPYATTRSWNAIRLTQVTPVPGPPVTGDYNGNGVVDAADYVLWRKGSPQADGFDDDIIDEFDYFIWQENFGDTSGGSGLGAAAAVPEPAALGLLVLVGLVGCLSRRRHTVL
jgi:hypothetical protein